MKVIIECQTKEAMKNLKQLVEGYKDCKWIGEVIGTRLAIKDLKNSTLDKYFNPKNW